ncbi:hypothetical protein FIBSPDRAFT_934971 [Athelia psychrophila]|uniref:Uncharacterized protein n=1 Tax=Athelia psychrophila TaxID=1759441 RepID=A0A166EK16_9AGAM|nr:hypothetical protein FIBSPDRAFT_934971 [Fibularhizoctonia sp. CBS 109695]
MGPLAVLEAVKARAECGEEAEKVTSRNRAIRFIRNKADANAIGDLSKAITRSLEKLKLERMLNIEIITNNVRSAGSILLTWLTLALESARATAAGISGLESGLHNGLQATTGIGSEPGTHARATATALSSVEVKVNSGLTKTQNVGEVIQVSPLGIICEKDAEVVLVTCQDDGRRNHQ